MGLDIAWTQAVLFRTVDKTLDIARRILFVINAIRFEQSLNRCELIGCIENLKRLRQACVAVVRAQHAITKTMESANPQTTRIDRQNRRHARNHLARSLIGKRDSEDS
jgi:hypothetical protein